MIANQSQVDNYDGGTAQTGGFAAPTGGTTSGTTGTTSSASVPAERAGGGGVGTGQYLARVQKGNGNVPIATPGPAIRVPAGSVVEVYPIGDNSGIVYTGEGPQAAISGPRSFHPVGAPVVTYSVTNVSEIWVFGAINDGVLFRIQRRG